MKTLIKNALILDGVNYLVPTPKNLVITNNLITEIIGDEGDEGKVSYDRVIDVKSAIVTSGIVDLHVHISDGYAKIGSLPDTVGCNLGVTSIFDAGTYGADTFSYCYDNLIKKAVTKVYAFLNVASCGLTTLSELTDLENIDEVKIKETVKAYQDVIVGLKARASSSVVGNQGLLPIIKAKEIASKLGLPLMVHIGNPPPRVDEVLDLLTAGDIVTHACHNKKECLVENNMIREKAILAKKRGVLFDVGHGSASFSFDIAKFLINHGFKPDFISTDIYDKNIEHPVKSQLYVMTKLMACGLSLTECVKKVTSDIYDKFKIKNKGQIKEGYIADLSILRLQEGNYLLEDSVGETVACKQLIVHEGVLIDGKYYQNNSKGDEE